MKHQSLFVSVASFLLVSVNAFSPVATFCDTRVATTRNSASTTERMMLKESNSELPPLSSRRSWLSTTGVATGALLTQGIFPDHALAVDTKLDTFEDPVHKFELKVPSGWEKSVQTLPDRRKITLYMDPAHDGSLLFFAYTPIRDDFTSLSSFGSVDEVGAATILPKGELAGQQENESEMIKSESKKNAYFFDYTAKTPGQPKTHFRTIFALAPVEGSAGSTLVTLTAQTPETRYAELKPLYDEIMDSYGKLK